MAVVDIAKIRKRASINFSSIEIVIIELCAKRRESRAVIVQYIQTISYPDEQNDTLKKDHCSFCEHIFRGELKRKLVNMAAGIRFSILLTAYENLFIDFSGLEELC